MTDVLAEMIKSNFEIINSKQIAIYGSEKLEINLRSERLITNLNRLADKRIPFTNHKIIEGIAAKIFDVDFLYETKEGIGPAVFFMPSINDKYNNNHIGHYIRVHLPEFYPVITISTGAKTLIGAKGNFVLLDKQRENYFQFVKKVHDEFLTKYLIKEIFS